jgi:hypothetical protein
VKPSEVLKEAARIACDVPYDESEWICGCGAIWSVASDDSTEDVAMGYFTMFKPAQCNSLGWFGSYAKSELAAKEHRVLSLCMAAAIAESEDL